MWPAEPKVAKSPLHSDAKPHESKFDAPPREFAPAPARRAEPEAPMPRQGSEPRTAAILKSGVVDGMGYTLYVDGSIEAELPQGTLRFASINELRSHLEKSA
jgi:predicted cobalt transporter CbtA